jgi:hypothetical protein
MKPYDTMIMLYALKTLLDNGHLDTAKELIDKILKEIEEAK